MSQTKLRANLSAANFPLVTDFWGRTVIVPQYDENYVAKQKFSGDDPDQDKGIPQVYYCHNVMPDGQGFKSIAYSTIIPGLNGVTAFDKIIPCHDPDMGRGLIGIGKSGQVYIYAPGDAGWRDISSQTGGWAGGTVTYGYADGFTYICLAGFGIFKVSIFFRKITTVSLSGLTASAILAIVGAANYLVVTDGVVIYWSSTTNPEDFVPSLVTGAGSETPNDVEGLIVALTPLNNGFCIYTSVAPTLASFSGNARFPWVFRSANNGKGISDIQQVSFSGDNGTNYSWGTAGIQRVSSQGCTTIMSEIADFLAGKIFEDFDTTTNKLTKVNLSTPLVTKIAYIAARFLVISYGISSLTHALVYDTTAKRWGKLKIAHVSCFEVTLNTDSGAVINAAASAKRTIGFLQADGTVKLAIFDIPDQTAQAVVILGKFQIIRSRLATCLGVDVDSVDFTNSLFNTFVFTTQDGKTISNITTPTISVAGAETRSYTSRVTGVNHSIVFVGAFNLTSVEVTLINNARR